MFVFGHYVTGKMQHMYIRYHFFKNISNLIREIIRESMCVCMYKWLVSQCWFFQYMYRIEYNCKRRLVKCNALTFLMYLTLIILISKLLWWHPELHKSPICLKYIAWTDYFERKCVLISRTWHYYKIAECYLNLIVIQKSFTARGKIVRQLLHQINANGFLRHESAK